MAGLAFYRNFHWDRSFVQKIKSPQILRSAVIIHDEAVIFCQKRGLGKISHA